MDKTAPDYPHNLPEPPPAAMPDGAASAFVPVAPGDQRVAAGPSGVLPSGEVKVEDDPYWGEAPPMDATLVPGDGSDVGQPDETAKHNRQLRELLEIAVIVVVVFLGVRSAIQNFKVEGDSMMPTLHSEQYLLVNRALYSRYDANFLSRLFDPDTPADVRYLFQQPQRGDIVVFESPSEPRDFIKRVVAVAGETVEVRPDFDPVGKPGLPCGECGVYINGVLIEELYVRNTPDYVVPPTLVPPGHVFVLGDNRRNSSDSHVFGPLSVERIVGAAFMSYLPTETLGFIPHPTYAEIGPPAQP